MANRTDYYQIFLFPPFFSILQEYPGAPSDSTQPVFSEAVENGSRL